MPRSSSPGWAWRCARASRIVSTSRRPRAPQAGGLPRAYRLVRIVRDALVRAGLREVRPLPFASTDDLELTGDDDAIPVANPLRAEEGFLRTRLMPGLLHAVARNKAW